MIVQAIEVISQGDLRSQEDVNRNSQGIVERGAIPCILASVLHPGQLLVVTGSPCLALRIEVVNRNAGWNVMDDGSHVYIPMAVARASRVYRGYGDDRRDRKG